MIVDRAGPGTPPAPPASRTAGVLGPYLRLAAGLVVLVGAALALRAARALGESGVGRVDPIARFLLAVAVVVVVTHLLGALFGRLRQPPVIGEIVGGLLLGPSVFAALWPSGSAWLFSPEVTTALGMVAQLGLVMFMFLLGCDLRLAGVGRRGSIGFVVLGAMGLPFLGGIAVALAGRHLIAGPAGRTTAYVLFFALAVSITALPVLARILVDLGIEGTRLGALALTCAAVGDGVMWAVLTVVLGLVGAGHAVTTVGLGGALILITFLWIRPALVALLDRAGSGNAMAMLTAGAIGFAAMTYVVGLHPAIGAFLFGAIIPRDAPVVERIQRQLSGFVLAILLPLFFAGVGLSTSIGLLGHSVAHWLLFAAVLVTAIATKFAGAAAGARLAGLSGRDALRLGTLMNCRGVTELVVAAIGFQYKLVNALGLIILVLVALLTTAATTPLIRLLELPTDAPAGRP